MNCKNDHKIRSNSSSQGSVLQLSWDCFAAIKGSWDVPFLAWIFLLLAQFYWLHMWEWYFLHPPSYSIGREMCW